MSTTESKKKSPSSSSSKHSTKEHHETKDTDKHKDKKKADDDVVPVEEVHTANNWEDADLGDSQRKQKFLRLMGAKKRKDEGRTDPQDPHDNADEDDVSPDKKHCRSKVETEIINRDLEKQFNESLQSKIAHTNHGGLGFHGGDNTISSSSTDWHHQSTKTSFVPAKTDVGSSMDHVVVDTTAKTEEKSSDKEEKKKKSKS